ncbi:Glutaredoxin [Dillenia turbinata]|uniref:Glutaredoxin n=1 Tax=Dillenia turbinata TaxID=194707 RepID=A0AAN8UP82_9MAGN
MQEALPYKTWQPHAINMAIGRSIAYANPVMCAEEIVKGKTIALNMVSENAIIVFGKTGCCLTHVVKRLLLTLGVNPAVCDVDKDDEESMIKELENISGSSDGQVEVQFPVVFIGGKFFGGLDRIMATHITGELVPELKKAGALWL